MSLSFYHKKRRQFYLNTLRTVVGVMFCLLCLEMTTLINQSPKAVVKDNEAFILISDVSIAQQDGSSSHSMAAEDGEVEANQTASLWLRKFLGNFLSEMSLLSNFFLRWNETKIIGVAIFVVLLLHSISVIKNWDREIDQETKDKQRLAKELKDKEKSS